MVVILQVLIIALQLYLLVLLARIVVDWVQVLARDYRPRGPMLVLFEVVYTLTDPPLRALRRVIPPLRIGQVVNQAGLARDAALSSATAHRYLNLLEASFHEPATDSHWD